MKIESGGPSGRLVSRSLRAGESRQRRMTTCPPHPVLIPISCPQCGASKQIPKPEAAPEWAIRCTILCHSCWGDPKEGTVL